MELGFFFLNLGIRRGFFVCGARSTILILDGDAIMMAATQVIVLEGSYAVVFVEDFWRTDPQLLHPAAYFWVVVYRSDFVGRGQ
jgi:hypothetical protein